MHPVGGELRLAVELARHRRLVDEQNALIFGLVGTHPRLARGGGGADDLDQGQLVLRQAIGVQDANVRLGGLHARLVVCRLLHATDLALVVEPHDCGDGAGQGSDVLLGVDEDLVIHGVLHVLVAVRDLEHLPQLVRRVRHDRARVPEPRSGAAAVKRAKVRVEGAHDRGPCGRQDEAGLAVGVEVALADHRARPPVQARVELLAVEDVVALVAPALHARLPGLGHILHAVEAVHHQPDLAQVVARLAAAEQCLQIRHRPVRRRASRVLIAPSLAAAQTVGGVRACLPVRPAGLGRGAGIVGVAKVVRWALGQVQPAVVRAKSVVGVTAQGLASHLRLIDHSVDPCSLAQRERVTGDPEQGNVRFSEPIFAQESEVGPRGLGPRRLDELRRLRVIKVEEARDGVRQLPHVVL
eukprot:scaffold88082_cov63-Phaeocystis_antarctica.AAC.4